MSSSDETDSYEMSPLRTEHSAFASESLKNYKWKND